MTSIPRTARYVVRNQAETAEDAESTGEHHRIQHAIFRFFPDFVLFDGFIQLWNSPSLVKRTPESEKKKTYVYLIKRKIKKKTLVQVPGMYISPFVLALEGGVNSNLSSRERLFLGTANPRQDPNRYVRYSKKQVTHRQSVRRYRYCTLLQRYQR